MEKLKEKWGITNNFQLIIIFIVFAITGSSSVYQDTIENCAICDVATENEDVDFLFPASQISIPSTVDFSYVTLPVTNKLVVPSFFLRNNFFGRPPPRTEIYF